MQLESLLYMTYMGWVFINCLSLLVWVERGYKQLSDEKTTDCLWYIGDYTTYCGYVGIIQK